MFHLKKKKEKKEEEKRKKEGMEVLSVRSSLPSLPPPFTLHWEQDRPDREKPLPLSLKNKKIKTMAISK